jgi:hypothetical protein
MVFGNDGDDAVRSEVQQLHDQFVMRPRRAFDISREQKHATLAYLMFLKKKDAAESKDVDVLTGARKPHTHHAKMPLLRPFLFLTCLIDAHKSRDVALR